MPKRFALPSPKWLGKRGRSVQGRFWGEGQLKDWNAQTQPGSLGDEPLWVGTFDYSSAANAVRAQLAALA
jgi:hypothetical protein